MFMQGKVCGDFLTIWDESEIAHFGRYSHMISAHYQLIIIELSQNWQHTKITPQAGYATP